MNNTQHTLNAKLTNIFNSLSCEERNDLYRYIRYLHVRKDIESQIIEDFKKGNYQTLQQIADIICDNLEMICENTFSSPKRKMIQAV